MKTDERSRGVAVVTGGSAGIGRACVREFARAGFDVAIIARGRAGLEAAASEVRELGRRALPVEADVADDGAVFAAAARIERDLGDIDVWVNNAMTTTFAPVQDVEPPDFARAVDVTFLGQVWGTMAALDRMRPRDRGAIVNIGSALAFVGIPLQSAYCASKFACRGFFESTRAELIHQGSGIRLSMVHMPAVDTPQFGWCKTTMHRHPQPVPPIYEPERVATHVVATAMNGRRSRVVGSWNRMLVAIGSVVPGYANHFAAVGAWATQLTDRPLDPDRPVNLRDPADDDRDAGSRGIFSSRSGGVLDPGFLASLPGTAATFGRAGIGYARDRMGSFRRTRSSEQFRAVACVAGAALALGAWRRAG
ncbi:MAG: SDR family oxidoreductase [Thermoleophilia bacterium]